MDFTGLQVISACSSFCSHSPAGLFFFQAEDGIRGADVTGVQTCALPIWPGRVGVSRRLSSTIRSATALVRMGRRLHLGDLWCLVVVVSRFRGAKRHSARGSRDDWRRPLAALRYFSFAQLSLAPRGS